MVPITALREHEKMKHGTLDTRKKVMSAVCTAFAGGIECAATFLGYARAKQLENRIYGSAGSAPMTDSEIHALEHEQGTTHLPDYICAMYGGVFVALPDSTATHADLFELSFATSTARGAVDLLIKKALEDGEIDDAEGAVILEAHRKHIAARVAEVGGMIVAHQR